MSVNHSYKDLQDHDLVLLLNIGDSNAFTEVYHRYKAGLYQHALRMLNDKDEAKDVVQELFTSLWNKRDAVILTTSLSSYLYTGIRNRIFDIFSHQKVAARYVESLQEFIDQGEFITDHWVRERELAAIIDYEIGQLPAKMREVFELSRKLYLSHRQIAEKLELSEKTVKKQIAIASKKLRPKLDLMTMLFLAHFFR